MIVARWKIDARFGHKEDVFDSLKWWTNEIAPQIGWESNNMRMMSGSIGATESCVVLEVELDSMADLEESWNTLRDIEQHREWGRNLEPNVVSGTHRWEVYRLS